VTVAGALDMHTFIFKGGHPDVTVFKVLPAWGPLNEKWLVMARAPLTDYHTCLSGCLPNDLSA